MRKLVASSMVVCCLVACHADDAITSVDDGPFGGVYSLRSLDDAPLPLYFWPYWYPGRGGVPGVQTTTIRSAELTIRPDGTFIWSTLLEEVAAKPNSMLPDYVAWTVRRDAYGKWTHTPSTGAVSLEGTDQFGPYVLTGSTTSSGLTLSSSLSGGENSTFVFER
jgi:hypothetical protein